MNNRAYISASSNYFSGEGEVKRRRLDIEERRLLLDEKEQVIRMVNIGVYTPQTARDKIEEIDQRMRLPALETTHGSQMQGQSPLGSHGRYQTRSPSPGHHSPSWDIEDPDKSLDDNEEGI